MHARNKYFVFTFCFGLCSLVAISGSQELKSSHQSQNWSAYNHIPTQEGTTGAALFFQGYLDIAQQFLKNEKFFLKNFLTTHICETPQVIIDLPPATANFSSVN